MSAMRSASSMTSVSIASRSSSLRSSRSISRPGVRDRDFDAAAEVADLAVHRRAAVERGDAHAGFLGERLQDVDDLLGQLAGRDEHERGRVPGRAALEPLQHREAEREGLARARLGLAAHVAAGERVGDGRVLDRKGLVDALGREGVDELGPQAELCEGGHLVFPFRTSVVDRPLLGGSTRRSKDQRTETAVSEAASQDTPVLDGSRIHDER